MRIKKFNESEVLNISADRVEEIIKFFTDLTAIIDNKSELINALANELDNYKSDSKTKIDQIDDSISNLQLIKSDFSNVKDKLDNVVNNLKDYNENGREFFI